MAIGKEILDQKLARLYSANPNARSNAEEINFLRNFIDISEGYHESENRFMMYNVALFKLIASLRDARQSTVYGTLQNKEYSNKVCTANAAADAFRQLLKSTSNICSNIDLFIPRIAVLCPRYVGYCKKKRNVSF